MTLFFIELKAVEVIVLGVVGVDIALVLAAEFSMTFSFGLLVVALHVVDELLEEVVHLTIALFAAFALVEHVVRVDLISEVDLSAFPFSFSTFGVAVRTFTSHVAFVATDEAAVCPCSSRTKAAVVAKHLAALLL